MGNKLEFTDRLKERLKTDNKFANKFLKNSLEDFYKNKNIKDLVNSMFCFVQARSQQDENPSDN